MQRLRQGVHPEDPDDQAQLPGTAAAAGEADTAEAVGDAQPGSQAGSEAGSRTGFWAGSQAGAGELRANQEALQLLTMWRDFHARDAVSAACGAGPHNALGQTVLSLRQWHCVVCV